MSYLLKILLMISVVLYVMDLISGINYVLKIRKFSRLFDQTFHGREEETITKETAEQWQEYYKKTVVYSFTLFIAFVIPSFIFSVLLIILNL